MDSTTRHGYRQHHELLQLELVAWSAQHEAAATPSHQRIVHVLDWLELERFVGRRPHARGAPERSRWALANAFVAKAVLNLGQTRQLLDRLRVDPVLRRLLGFDARHKLPSEATFSRAFAQFAAAELPQRAPKPAPGRGRKRAGQSPGAPRSRIPAQLTQSAQQAIADLPTACNKGIKRDARGNPNAWIGYKLHLDVACCGVPLSALCTSASCHDNQVSIPLARLSAQRVTSLYTLMDAAYDSQALRDFEHSLGHVPIVAINPRGRQHPPTLEPAQVARFAARTAVERAFGRLKDSLACDAVWVKGQAKVFCQAMFSVLALSAQALMALALEPPPAASG